VPSFAPPLASRSPCYPSASLGVDHSSTAGLALLRGPWLSCTASALRLLGGTSVPCVLPAYSRSVAPGAGRG